MSTSHLETPVLLPEPAPEDIALESVFHALGDPVRLEIVRKLNATDEAKACGTFDLPVGKSTASHHFKVLREAGVAGFHDEGTRRYHFLRRDDLDARFPGLLDTVLRAAEQPAGVRRLGS